MTVVFEATETGPRITYTQAGLGDPTRFTSEPVNRGMYETLEDLVLWLERGIAFPRHRDVRAQAGLGSVFDHPDIAFFVRDHNEGDEVDIVFARASEVHHGRGRLGAVVPASWTLPV